MITKLGKCFSYSWSGHWRINAPAWALPFFFFLFSKVLNRNVGGVESRLQPVLFLFWRPMGIGQGSEAGCFLFFFASVSDGILGSP